MTTINTKFNAGDVVWYTDHREHESIECEHCKSVIKRRYKYVPVRFTVGTMEITVKDGLTLVSYDSKEQSSDGDTSLVFWASEKDCFATLEDAMAMCYKKNAQEDENV